MARKSSSYTGGKHLNSYGYVQFRYRDETGKMVFPLEHRMNMEYHLGRKLWD